MLQLQFVVHVLKSFCGCSGWEIVNLFKDFGHEQIKEWKMKYTGRSHNPKNTNFAIPTNEKREKEREGS